MSKEHFTVISKANCPWCTKAKQLIHSMGFDYKLIDLTGNGTAMELCRLLRIETVPMIYDENGATIGGYEELVRWLNVPKPAQNSTI